MAALKEICDIKPTPFVQENNSPLISCLSWGETKSGKTAFLETWPMCKVLDFGSSLNALQHENKNILSTTIVSNPLPNGQWELRIAGQRKPSNPAVSILRQLRDKTGLFAPPVERETIGIHSVTIVSKLMKIECEIDSSIGATQDRPNGSREPFTQKIHNRRIERPFQQGKTFFRKGVGNAAIEKKEMLEGKEPPQPI